MTTEYAPGTVAVATVRGRLSEVVILSDAGEWFTASEIEGFYDHPKADVEDIRPLVVIDPEDREEVELLAKAWDDLAETNFPLGDAPLTLRGYRMQAALREYANPTPPKPEEPTGLGAVVEDADGVRWVRMTDHEGANWHRWNAPDDIRPWRFYADIAAVRILSPGVDE